MRISGPFSQRGFLVIGFVIVVILLLGSLLLVHTAAVVSIADTSRALEVARQNWTLKTTLELLTREGVQERVGVPPPAVGRGLRDELAVLTTGVRWGDARLDSLQIGAEPRRLKTYPDFSGAPDSLLVPSSRLLRIATPQLRHLIGDLVAEGPPARVTYTFVRPGPAQEDRWSVEVECVPVAVPLCRFPLVLYDLPDEVGVAGPAEWPVGVNVAQIAPRGLAVMRDPAAVSRRSLSDAVREDAQRMQPFHFRNLAVAAEAYQHLFSTNALQRLIDYAGVTHHVLIGGGASNPRLAGGTDAGPEFQLDLAALGEGNLAGFSESKEIFVVRATADGQRLILGDTGGASSAVCIVAVGLTDRSSEPLRVELASSLQRPVVFIGFRVRLTAGSGRFVNGALLFDKDSQVAAGGPPLTVGHLSCWAGGSVSPGSFQFAPMPNPAVELCPRVVYVASQSRLF